MSDSNAISIIVVTDEHYIILLAALLKSIQANHKTPEHLHIYVIEDGVKTESKSKLHASISNDKIAINWIKLDDANSSDIKLPNDRTSFPLNIYMRLFAQEIIPAGTNKALFLDVDMIVLTEISELWNIDLCGNVIGAVQDPHVPTFDNDWGGVANYKTLGFKASTKYFNTGLLLIDLNKWRVNNVARQVIDCVTENIKFANYPDQYGLNIVLANQWLALDTRWNYFASGVLKEPFIIHFTSRKPIYKSYSNNIFYKRLFDNYLAGTPWAEAKPLNELERYLKKLKNIGIKIKRQLLS